MSALSRGHRPLLVLVAVLAVSFAALAHGRAADLRDVPALHNAALTDSATTSEINGVVDKAVNEVFSYDYTKPENTDRAAREHLAGEAVGQHEDMLARVRAQGEKQKLVLTTTVTHSAVELIDGDRARVLVFADQSNVSTAEDGPAASAPAMFAVDVRHTEGAWRITKIDTFSR
ncbi:hypothetical protein [Streptomyces sp. KLOTTS4A1]|uniref:hypothetical protein n=1 Tax=Streptomyces sp. KLOTTS4A1 TaxID=3390996 RepID=UPI0039F579DD